jgi:hypothetical protein
MACGIRFPVYEYFKNKQYFDHDELVKIRHRPAGLISCPVLSGPVWSGRTGAGLPDRFQLCGGVIVYSTDHRTKESADLIHLD